MESVKFNANMIEDPKIQNLYGAIRTITRGRIWSWRRFAEIVRMNLGVYDAD